MLQKLYGPDRGDDQRRYSPAKCIGVEGRVITGNPDPAHVSTSFVERQNLTMRTGMRRFTRLTNGFSKKIENHAAAVSLHFQHYHFARPHKNLKNPYPPDPRDGSGRRGSRLDPSRDRGASRLTTDPMDDHQRRVWAEMLRQIDDWEQGRIGLPRLVENLYGLLELLPGTTWITGKASEKGGEEAADEVYLRWTELDAEMELRTEPWAPAGYPPSDDRLNAAIASIREHVHRVLNESPPSN